MTSKAEEWRRIFAEPYSLRELAKRCGVSFATLSRLGRGIGLPDHLTLRRIEAYLHGEPFKKGKAKKLFSSVVTLNGISFKLTLEELTDK